MSNTIDRTRSQKCYTVYDQTLDPDDKLDAERVFCLETAQSHAIAIGSQQTADCLDGLINEIVHMCTDTKHAVTVTVAINGMATYTMSTMEDLGMVVEDTTTCSWAAEMLRSAATFVENNPECGCVDCDDMCPACGEPLDEHEHEVEA